MMLLEHTGKALIGNVAHAIDGESRGSFLEQKGTDFNGINTTENRITQKSLLNTSEVVDEPRRVENVQGGKGIAFGSLSIRREEYRDLSRRIVVVSVDCKDGQGNVQVRIFVVDGTGTIERKRQLQRCKRRLFRREKGEVDVTRA